MSVGGSGKTKALAALSDWQATPATLVLPGGIDYSCD
jgi:hypothetical protein